MKLLRRSLLEGDFHLPEDVGTGPLERYPEKVLQFGEGRFLRGFVDWMIDRANSRGFFNGRVVVVPPRSDKLVPVINSQEGLYTLFLRGLEQGRICEKRSIVTCISRALSPRDEWEELLRLAAGRELRLIISNTTEAGIVYRREDYVEGRCPESFPAKLTALLYHRYKCRGDNPASGLVVIPCELVPGNGDLLREIVIRLAKDWRLPPSFLDWLAEENFFINNLVDRIVTVLPREELKAAWEQMGYEDRLLIAAEPFHFWALEGPREVRELFPLHRAGLNVQWVDDVAPLRRRKVRLLNGVHTATAAVALLQGIETVREALEDPLTGAFMRGVLYEEIIPSLEGGASKELPEFAAAVLERFRNPFIRHRWADISVNSVAKFRERVLPSIYGFVQQKGELPRRLVLSLAALILLYAGPEIKDKNWSRALPEQYSPQDEPGVLEGIQRQWSRVSFTPAGLEDLVKNILQCRDFWGDDLTTIPGLVWNTARRLGLIFERGLPHLLAEGGEGD